MDRVGRALDVVRAQFVQVSFRFAVLVAWDVVDCAYWPERNSDAAL